MRVDIRKLLLLRDKGKDVIIPIHVRTIRDVAILIKLLDGYEAKSVYIYTKGEFCKGQHLWLYPLADTKYKPVILLRYLKCWMKRFHQVFHAYNVNCGIFAFIYKPWRIAIVDGGGYNCMYHGGLEKIYQRLKVELSGYEIQVVVHEW